MIKEAMEISAAVLQGCSDRNLSVDEDMIRADVIAAIDKALPAEIRDMQAFIIWAAKNGQTTFWVATNLIHDINGILKCKPFFISRTAGYSDLI